MAEHRVGTVVHTRQEPQGPRPRAGRPRPIRTPGIRRSTAIGSFFPPIQGVRRRVAAGIGIVLVGVVLLVGVPLWSLLVPAWDAAVLWVLIGLAGLVALVVVGLLDRGRAAARRELTRIAESTAGWE